jgi:hypothetical protein
MTLKNINSSMPPDSNTPAFKSTPVEPPKLSEKAEEQVRRIRRWEDSSARNAVHLDD